MVPESGKQAAIRDVWPFREGPPRRLVVKLGSNLLSTPEGTLDASRVRVASERLARLHKAGTQVIIVTSGAVAAGMGVTRLRERPTELPKLQALAAIGQSEVMAAYIESFRAHGIAVAQVLLTRSDLEDRTRHLNARFTLETALALGAVPVINENDSVTTEELTFGDNDLLSAIIAVKLNAELLVILTDIDGLYTGNPRKDPDARLIEVIERVTPEIEALAQGPGSIVGRGGMITKVSAARHAARFGITAVIANGRDDEMMSRIAAGDFRGTLFLPSAHKMGRGKARAHWISMRRPRGAVVIDDGASKALVEGGKSLLPVGVVSVEGAFVRGDVISIRNGANQEVARGITNFSASEVAIVRGHRVKDLPALLGSKPTYEEVVHRDNLYLRV